MKPIPTIARMYTQAREAVLFHLACCRTETERQVIRNYLDAWTEKFFALLP